MCLIAGWERQISGFLNAQNWCDSQWTNILNICQNMSKMLLCISFVYSSILVVRWQTDHIRKLKSNMADNIQYIIAWSLLCQSQYVSLHLTTGCNLANDLCISFQRISICSVSIMLSPAIIAIYHFYTNITVANNLPHFSTWRQN